MDHEQKVFPMPEICDTLAQLNDAGVLPVKALEKALGKAPRSGYAYLNGTVLDAQQLRNLFQNPPLGAKPTAIQGAILNWLCDGTAWESFLAPQPDDLDTNLCFESAMKVLRVCANALEIARDSDDKGHMELVDAHVLHTQLTHTIQSLINARRAVDALTPKSLPAIAAN